MEKELNELQKGDNSVFEVEKKEKRDSIIPYILVFFKFMLPIFFIFGSIIFIGEWINTNKSINEFCQKNLEYVTSIVNEENKEEAYIYNSNLDVDRVIYEIVIKNPKIINKIIAKKQGDETRVGVFTKNEYAYVYHGENNETIIQVSDNKYVSPKSKLYGYNNSDDYYSTYVSESSDVPIYEEFLVEVKEGKKGWNSPFGRHKGGGIYPRRQVTAEDMKNIFSGN